VDLNKSKSKSRAATFKKIGAKMNCYVIAYRLIDNMYMKGCGLIQYRNQK